jgi:hypothetical protein
MMLKKKLSLGLAFLFIIIFSLAIFSSYYIQKLSKESENILRDNYDSLVYSKKMFLALDDMKMSILGRVFNHDNSRDASRRYAKLFESGKAVFDRNLKAEKNNITEVHEREYVDTLNMNYLRFLELGGRIVKGPAGGAMFFREFMPVYENMRLSIGKINDVNMQAVVRKNQLAKRDSANIIIYMALIGSVCIVLALGYFWYFPFYISNSVSYLSNRMKDLLKNNGISHEIESNDELHIMLQSIKLLENKSSLKEKRRKKKNT